MLGIAKYYCVAILVAIMYWWKAPNNVNCQLEQGRGRMPKTDCSLVEKNKCPK